jgi:RNA polymerase-binding transcription factor DksA
MKNEMRSLQGRFEKGPERGNPEGAITNGDEVVEILGRAPATLPSARRVPAKWRWHHRTLLALQFRLIGERGELLRAGAQPLEPHSMDEADSATDEFDHDLALTQLSAEQDALYEVNAALERIFDGSYGICEQTGEVISAARLRAVPWTRFTCAIKEAREKNGSASRAHLSKLSSVRGQGRVRFAAEEAVE